MATWFDANIPQTGGTARQPGTDPNRRYALGGITRTPPQMSGRPFGVEPAIEQGGITGYQPSGGRIPITTPQMSGRPFGVEPQSGGSAQDPRAFLKSLAAGGKLTPQQLKAAEPQLQAMGIRLLGANSEGIQSKIMLPSGQSVDVIRDAGGDNGFQWLTGSGGGGASGGGGGMMGGAGLPPGYWTGNETGGGQYPLASAGGPGLAQPWTTPFKSPGDFQSPGDFDPSNILNSKGFKDAFDFRMAEGQKALERSASARGTLLTGGTLRDLTKYASGEASQEFGNAYNRALGENELAYGRAWNENNQAYGRGLGEYQMAHDIYGQNQNNLFNRLSNIAGLGQTAAGQLGQYGSAYGQQAGNLITGAGNAQAAGQVGSGNAWAGALGNIGQSASQLPLWYSILRQNQAGTVAPGGGGYGAYPGNI